VALTLWLGSGQNARATTPPDAVATVGTGDDAASYGPSATASACTLWSAKFSEMQGAVDAFKSDGNAQWLVYGDSLVRRFDYYVDRLNATAWLSREVSRNGLALATAYRRYFKAAGQPMTVDTLYGIQLYTMNWTAACFTLPARPQFLFNADGSAVAPSPLPSPPTRMQ
jgi:hypothetical protein